MKILKLQNEIDQLKNQQQQSDLSISFEILKEIVKVYDGGNNFNVWLFQLLNVQKNFKVGANTTRELPTHRYNSPPLPLNHHAYTSEDIEPGSVAIQSRNININDESAADIRQKADTAFPSHRQRSAYNPIYIHTC